MAEEEKKTAVIQIPPPPRVTGDAEADARNTTHYLHEFYNKAITQQGLVQRAEYTAAQETLQKQIDPANATVATAQKTANDALTLASTANATAEANQKVIETFGTITFENGETSKTHTFSEAEEQADDQYSVVLSVKERSGSAGINSTLVIGQTYTKDDFTVSINDAPGSGNSVIFNWHLRRKTGA